MSLPSWLGSGPYPPAPDKPRRTTTPKGPVLLVGAGPFTCQSTQRKAKRPSERAAQPNDVVSLVTDLRFVR